MKFTLEPYQETAAKNAAISISKNKKIILQLATGGGKTAIASTIVHRVLNKNPNAVIWILVHRSELLMQMRRTLYEWYEIISYPVVAETKRLQQLNVFVGMCETVYRRISKNKNYLPSPDLVIIDEAHRGEFFKLYRQLDCLVLGLTATPLSAKKIDPLKNYFNDLVAGVGIPELIELNSVKPLRGLVENRTYRPKTSININQFHIRGGDFDEREMSTEFSKSKHVKNCVEQYRKFANGKKAIVFNCGISHSNLVTEAFLECGYPARHLDGNSSDRAQIFKWFKETDGAILCNVDIATTGFDEPSIECVVMNRSTLSLPLWLQCTGRGSRPYPGKEMFTIIDLGANTLLHGDWCDDRDWVDIFYNPPKKSDKKGVAPVKDCPNCEALISAVSMKCKYCGYEFPEKPPAYDTNNIELVLNIRPVKELIEQNADKKDYYVFFNIGNSIATQAKYKTKKMDDGTAQKLLSTYETHIEEWGKEKSIKINRWHKTTAKNHLYSQLQKTFPEWQPTL